MSQRHSLFISHANPEDNEFTIWLGAKLAAEGYDVWADVLRLIGGDDWQRKLEEALREQATKVLLVGTQKAVAKQGVRNEIQIASDVGRKLNDPNFIIPLRLERFEAPFLIAQAQYIDFRQSWAAGLFELLATLETEYHVPRVKTASTAPWVSLQSLHGKQLIQKPEPLISNWIRVRKLPETIHFYRSDDLRANQVDLTFPNVPFRDGLLSCEEHSIEGAISKDLDDALESGWTKLQIPVKDFRSMFANLANQALDAHLDAKGLRLYEMANGRKAWWFGANLPDARLSFLWQNAKGSRQLRGHSTKRKVYWHFGVSTSYRGGPIRHVRVKSRLVFSEDAITPLPSKQRMHRLRRSFAKGWRNARWRDMLLAFLYWLSGGETVVRVALATDQHLLIELPPIAYASPVSINEEDGSEGDSDDPDEDVTAEALEEEDPGDERDDDEAETE